MDAALVQDVGFSAKFRLAESGSYSSFELWVHVGGKALRTEAPAAMDDMIDFVEEALDRNAERFKVWGSSIGQVGLWEGPRHRPPAPFESPVPGGQRVEPPPPAHHWEGRR